MDRVPSHKLIERAGMICTCGKCTVCLMASRISNQVVEINLLHKQVNAYLDVAMMRRMVIEKAIQHCRKNRVKCALSHLTGVMKHSTECLRELAENP